jgi:predicted nucleic acid-binding protein
MKLLFDTNVILDVLLNREPFANEAIQLFCAVEEAVLQGVLAATTVTTIFYLSTKVLGQVAAKKAISSLLSLFEVAAINRIVLEDALSLSFTDFEDAVIYQAACHANAHGIVTRNIKDYKKSKLPIYSPSELISFLNGNGQAKLKN